MQGGQNNYQETQRQQKLVIHALKEQFKTLLLSLSANKSAQVKDIVIDAQKICATPANREVLK